MREAGKNKAKILIVDDVPQNIQVLANILKEAGYQMGFAQDGEAALSHTETTQFDLILLDIMMPDMDGYEVCAYLKKDKRKKDIPVIFITAKDETADKAKGFQLGAVDYITKPFDAHEVLLRVKTHLTIRNYATKLEQMVEERTRQLIHADRLATVGIFSVAIAHEIKNPLSYIIGNTRFLKLFWNTAKPILERHIHEDDTRNLYRDINNIDKKIEDILYGSNCISKLINSLRSYSKDTDTIKEKVLLYDIINDALGIINYKLKLTHTKTQLTIPPRLMIYCNRQKLSQVFINLIDNACDAMEDKGGKISIMAYSTNKEIVIKIVDNGPGIPEVIADKVFDPFFTTKSMKEGTGLGLFIVRNIIKEHEGKIFLAPNKEKGAEFHIILPLPK